MNIRPGLLGLAGVVLALSGALSCTAAGQSPAQESTAAPASAPASSPAPAGAATQEGTGAPVARVGGEAISEAELNRAVGNRLLSLQTQQYQIRRSVLDELIHDRLLDAEAKRLKLSRESLEQAEIDQKVTAVSPQEITSIYEANKARIGAMTEADARKSIAETLGERRREMRRQAYMKELGTRHATSVMLPPPRARIEIGDAPVRGPANAPVTIIEFTDYQCPYCARAATTLQQVMAKYPTQVKLVLRDFPLSNHPEAPAAAEAAHCAGDQGKYWQMHDAIFANPRDLTAPTLLKHAVAAGVDEKKYSSCVASKKYTARWQKDLAAGEEFGVTGTPAFFVNGRFIGGALPLEAFVQLIEEELKLNQPATK